MEHPIDAIRCYGELMNQTANSKADRRTAVLTSLPNMLTYARILMVPALVAGFYLEGRGELKPQDPASVSYYRNNRPIHSKIFWNLQPAERIKNLSRTGTAYFFFRGKKVMLLQADARDKNRNMTNNLEVVPGAIVDVKDDGLVVQASDGFVHIQRIRYQNKELDYKQWAKSWRIHIGEILG